MESEEDKIEKHESNVKSEHCELDFRPGIVIKESPSFQGARPKDPKVKIASSRRSHSIAICRWKKNVAQQAWISVQQEMLFGQKQFCQIWSGSLATNVILAKNGFLLNLMKKAYLSKYWNFCHLAPDWSLRKVGIF